MGVYSEYLEKQLSFEDLCKERKNQLKRISDGPLSRFSTN